MRQFLQKASLNGSMERGDGHSDAAAADLEEARYAFAARFVSAAMEGRDFLGGDIWEAHRLAALLRHWAYRYGLQALIVLHLLLPLFVSGHMYVLLACTVVHLLLLFTVPCLSVRAVCLRIGRDLCFTCCCHNSATP